MHKVLMRSKGTWKVLYGWVTGFKMRLRVS